MWKKIRIQNGKNPGMMNILNGYVVMRTLMVEDYIGKDDKGNVVGVQKSKKLMELIPSKITDTMGIVADVNLFHKGELEYIEIIVDKYPSLISYHGKYY